MSETFDDIVDTFSCLSDWEDRYGYIIELGREMPPLDASLRIAQTKVDGCASQVWIVPRVEGGGDSARFYFEGDSDAMIVRGLIAILKSFYCGCKLNDVASLDALGAFKQIELDQHLTSQRSNGLRSMIARIQSFGREEAA